MKKSKKIGIFLCFLLMSVFGFSQLQDSIPDTQVEPDVTVIEESNIFKNDTVKTINRIKLDGISAVVGDYVILDSDVEKTLIDLKTQGASVEDITECGLLGKLMEDRLYAHQAVQDSIIISDDEINGTSENQLQSLISKIGSLEKVLKYYKKEDEAGFRRELFQINKLRILSERMQQKIVGEIEITPEEVRQFYKKIPESERPVFGAQLEIAQIIKAPEVPEEAKQRVIDQLNSIRADVLDNGASFKVKAILYTADTGSRANGGFYSVTKETQFVKEFKDVAFSLQEGEISDPFETVFGFHIISLEKIRGQERDLRHILISPEVPVKAMEKAKIQLDSIRKQIVDGTLDFADAALQFSDQKETKYEGGLLRNPINFDSKFELTRMDPVLYNQVRNLKDNEVSLPILEEGDRGSTDKYKILKVTNRYDEHIADFSKDYPKIKDLALNEKRFEAIKKWLIKRIADTYVSVNGENKKCTFANNWVKE